MTMIPSDENLSNHGHIPLRFGSAVILLCVSVISFAQSISPPSPLQATKIFGITPVTIVDCGVVVPVCIDNRSQQYRRNTYHAYQATGAGTWSVTLQYADGAPPTPSTTWTSFGSSGVVTNITPSSGIGYGLGYHDYIHFLISGNATVSNYFATRDSWWSPSISSTSFPITVSQGGTGQETQATCDTRNDPGTDVGARINGCVATILATWNGGTVDARGDVGAMTTMVTLPRNINLMLGAGVYTCANNPCIQSSSGQNIITGISRFMTQVRYAGSGAADIIACGTSGGGSGILCEDLQVYDLAIFPMEGSVASVALHVWNGVGIKTGYVRLLHSSCTGGNSDANPVQNSCGTGSSTNGKNIGIFMDTTATALTIPEMGNSEFNQTLAATGRGTDANNAAGTTRDIWINGSSNTGSGSGYYAHITIDGTGDVESAHTVFECDYCSDVHIDGGQLFAGSIAAVISHSGFLYFGGTRFSATGTNAFSVDAASSDIKFDHVQLVNGSTIYSVDPAAARVEALIPCCGGGYLNFGSIPLAAGTITANIALNSSGPITVNSAGTPASRQLLNGGGVWTGALEFNANAVLSPSSYFIFSGTPSTGRAINVPDVGGTLSYLLPYNHSGTVSYTSHIVQDTATMSGGTVTVTLAGSAAYTSGSSYQCSASSAITTAPVTVVNNSSSSVTFAVTGGGSGVVSYLCAGN